MLTIGDGVDGFTLDPRSGEFVLSHPKLTIPKAGRTFSRAHMHASLRDLILFSFAPSQNYRKVRESPPFSRTPKSREVTPAITSRLFFFSVSLSLCLSFLEDEIWRTWVFFRNGNAWSLETRYKVCGLSLKKTDLLRAHVTVDGVSEIER